MASVRVRRGGPGLVIALLSAGCGGTSNAQPRSNAEVSITSGSAPEARRTHRDLGRVIPVSYEEDRFFAIPVVASTSIPLRIYLDTGGNNLLRRSLVERLGLSPIHVGEGDAARDEVHMPVFASAASIPPPSTREGRVIVADEISIPGSDDWSGILGPEWFSARCWELDYPKRRMRWFPSCEYDVPPGATVAPLGFKGGLFFPRVSVELDGRMIELLLDTGAHTRLTRGAHAALADGRDRVRATSFITESTFEAWRSNHPDWRVLEHAEEASGMSMIEVPEVVVAGRAIGPVWFTTRSDSAFREFMSQWMDTPIDGALGGNALREFRVVLDYPRARMILDDGV